jgi:hypothetical protein
MDYPFEDRRNKVETAARLIDSLTGEEKKQVTAMILNIIREQIALTIGNAIMAKLVWLGGLTIIGIFYWAVDNGILNLKQP